MRTFIPLAVLWAVTLGLVALSMRHTGGHLIYALDDAYIHMAMARNTAASGVWGMTPYGFSHTSSSPLWTLALALFYRLGGPVDWAPLVLNLLAGTGVILMLSRSGLPTAGVLAVILLVPLPAVIMTGQEHVLHLLLTLLFVRESAAALRGEQPGSRLTVLALLMCAARYEGLFAVALVAFWLRLKGHAGRAYTLGAAALLPLALVGGLAVAHGWHFLPSSILLKGNMSDLSRTRGIIAKLAAGDFHLNTEQLLDICRMFGGTALLNLARARHLLVLVVLLTLLLVRVRRTEVLLFLGMCGLHLQFARVGWFYRYEAYLVGLGLAIFATTLREKGINRILLLLAVFLLFEGTGERAIKAMGEVPLACSEIYRQQYQMAKFFKKYYTNAAIAVNDIGYVNYLTDLRCLDLNGLGTMAVCEARMALTYDAEQIDRITRAHQIRVAAIYDSWFDQASTGGLPRQWSRRGQWRMPTRLVVADTTVSFYALDGTEVPALDAHLREFASELPPEVVQTGPFKTRAP